MSLKAWVEAVREVTNGYDMPFADEVMEMLGRD